jgi:Tfp pilus assembly protein PilF
MKTIITFVIYFFVGIVVVIVLMKLFNPPRYHQVVGDFGRKYGYYEFAIGQYSRAIHLNANNSMAFNSRGVVRYYQRQYEYAIKDYDRAIELDSQYALAIKNRALAFLAIGNVEGSKGGYELACKLGSCEDFIRRCTELKTRCGEGDCISVQTAVTAGLCK